MANTHSTYGRFRAHYRELARHDLLSQVPLLLSEGDSWFSMPLYYNTVDWLETRASPVSVFLRMESSGDLATKMFEGANLRKLRRRLKDHAFDLVLLSAGGNDFVDEFLREQFRDSGRIDVDQAMDRVGNKRFKEIGQAYRRFIDSALEARPGITILGHSYDYPLRMGLPARLTVENIGLVALFKRQSGDWIHRHLRHALDDGQKREFTRRLIDRFVDEVLTGLKSSYPGHFDFVDFRGALPQPEDWNDEMHPTAEGFRQLAERMLPEIRRLLPAAKQRNF